MENVTTEISVIVFKEQSGRLGCAELVSLDAAQSYLKIVIVTSVVQSRSESALSRRKTLIIKSRMVNGQFQSAPTQI